jgi:hypothetical protein
MLEQDSRAVQTTAKSDISVREIRMYGNRVPKR